jgi:hypothetical protein
MKRFDVDGEDTGRFIDALEMNAFDKFENPIDSVGFAGSVTFDPDGTSKRIKWKSTPRDPGWAVTIGNETAAEIATFIRAVLWG